MKTYDENKKHDRLQQDCMLHLWNNYPETRRCCWHTPNEFPKDDWLYKKIKSYLKILPQWLLHIFAQYDKEYLFRLSNRKATGVIKGVTDLVLYHKGILHMFDIKLKGDKLSPEQKQFIEANEAQGGKFFEVNNLDEFKAYINTII